MYRAISTEEEQDVRQLFNTTADEIGVPRPLDTAGWYRVKEHLRAQSRDNVPAGWEAEHYRWIHAAACSPLVIDPVPSWSYCAKKGGAALCNRLAYSLGRPETGWGYRVDSALHMAMALALCALGGGVVAGCAVLLGFPGGAAPFLCGAMVTFLMVSWFVSSDTMTGVLGLIMALTNGYFLQTGLHVADGWTLAGRALGALFGALLVIGFLV